MADIGGTNARFGIVPDGQLAIRYEFHYSVSDYPDFYQLMEKLSTDAKECIGSTEPPSKACLAVACPAHAESISFTNSPWEFSIQDLKRFLGCEHLIVINDFEAIAHGITELDSNDLIKIGEGIPHHNAPKAILGAGSGLGVAAIVGHSSSYQVVDGEGGHIDFAPITAMHVEILGYLKKKYSRVSYERVLSGNGLLNLYAAISSLNERFNSLTEPSEVVAAALDDSDEIARLTLEVFCEVMGSLAGNLALIYGARGGVFIAGGVAPRFKIFMSNSSFRKFFVDKGRFRDYLDGIPTYLVTRSDTGLIGALKSLSMI